MSNKPEKKPKKNKNKPVWDLVIADLTMYVESVKTRGTLAKLKAAMSERNKIGIKKYGTPLQAFNGRNPLVDAYQEALDLCVYLKQAHIEKPRLQISQMYEMAQDLAYELQVQLNVPL